MLPGCRSSRASCMSGPRGIRYSWSRWELRAQIEEVERSVPASLQQLLDRQIGHLGATQQRLLEVASVAGMTFSSATLATGVDEQLERMEEACKDIVRHSHLIEGQAWASGRMGRWLRTIVLRMPSTRRYCMNAWPRDAGCNSTGRWHSAWRRFRGSGRERLRRSQP